jgi:hypothetical protein
MRVRFLYAALAVYLLLAAGQGAAQQVPLDLSGYQSFDGLMALAFDDSADIDVRARAHAAVIELHEWLQRRGPSDRSLNAQYRFAELEIPRLMDNPELLKTRLPVIVPPGSPIG